APVELVGSHGSEWESGFDRPPGDDDEVVLSRIRGALEEIVTRTPGAHVELKPTSAVLHVRPVEDPSLRERALADALAGPARLAGAHGTEGKNVVEIAVREASKGAAVETLVVRAGRSLSTARPTSRPRWPSGRGWRGCASEASHGRRAVGPGICARRRGGAYT